MRPPYLTVVFSLVGYLGVLPAGAASLELARELGALEAELAELRQVIQVQATDDARLARFQVRLERLEEEIRRLTGRIERLEFQDRQVNQRIDTLVGDLDDRLRGLEGAPTGAENGGFVPPDVPLSQGDGGPAMAAVPAEPAPREGELGTVPESALEGLPRPDPAAAVPPERRSLPPQEQYEQAMNQLRAGDYGAAEQGLGLFVELNEDHQLAPNAAYWLAETYYVRRDYAAAAAAFARNYRTYGPGAPKAPDNLLKLGMALQNLGESEKACRSLQELTTEFPDAPAHIRQATARERERAGCV